MNINCYAIYKVIAYDSDYEGYITYGIFDTMQDALLYADDLSLKNGYHYHIETMFVYENIYDLLF